MPFMLANWKIALGAAVALFIYWAGYHTKSVLVEAKQARMQNEAISQHNKDEADANARSAALEGTVADLRKQNNNLKGKLNVETRNASYRCAVPPGGMQLRKDAIASSPAR